LRFIRAVEVFGEAAAKISPEVQDAMNDIPWPQILAMRNRLIHAYFDVDRNILWKTATDELPALLPILEKLTRAGN